MPEQSTNLRVPEYSFLGDIRSQAGLTQELLAATNAQIFDSPLYNTIKSGTQLTTAMLPTGIYLRFGDGAPSLPAVAFGPPNWTSGLSATTSDSTDIRLHMSIAETTVMRWHPNRTLVRMGTTSTLNPVVSAFLAVNADYTTSGAAEEDMRSTTLPANTMQDGSCLEVWAGGTFANNGNSKDIRIYFGGSLISSYSLAGTTNVSWVIHGFITNDSNVQNCMFRSLYNNSAVDTDFVQTTKTMTSSQILKITGTGGAAADISLKQWIVRHSGRNTNT